MRTLLLCGAVACALLAGAAPALAADSAANTNPLYQESGNKGENPLFEPKSDLSQKPDRSKHSSDASAGKGADKKAAPASQTNPLYDEKGHSAENPLHKSE